MHVEAPSAPATAAPSAGGEASSAAPTAPPPTVAPRVVTVAPGLRVDRRARRVEVDGSVCIEAGWLEQVACSPGTREHESLVAVSPRPRDIHAALLLLGIEPGQPGSWRVEGEELVASPPTGPGLRVLIRWRGAGGEQHEVEAQEWIRDARTGTAPPLDLWRFAGSLLVPMKDGSVRYEADGSGSVVGLVTFGDEVVALPIVKPDSEAVSEPEWEAWTERLPPVGTPATLVLEVVEGGS